MLVYQRVDDFPVFLSIYRGCLLATAEYLEDKPNLTTTVVARLFFHLTSDAVDACGLGDAQRPRFRKVFWVKIIAIIGYESTNWTKNVCHLQHRTIFFMAWTISWTLRPTQVIRDAGVMGSPLYASLTSCWQEAVKKLPRSLVSSTHPGSILLHFIIPWKTLKNHKHYQIMGNNFHWRLLLITFPSISGYWYVFKKSTLW